MSQFKPGDLAMIIGSSEPADIGRVCEVVGVLIDDRWTHTFMGERHDGCADGVWSAFVDLGSDHGGIWMFGQNQLMPLKKDFQPEQQKSREVVE